MIFGGRYELEVALLLLGGQVSPMLCMYNYVFYMKAMRY